MLRNQIKLALRNFIKFKSYAIINLIGMGLALSIGILILVYILDEISFDKFHTKGDRVYKVVTTNPDGGGMETNAWPVARKLQDEFPEVEAAVYCRRAPASMMVNYEGNRYQHNIHYADNNFFNLFSFQFIEGDPGSALQSPYSIVITEDIKNLYFGPERVLGKTIILRDSLEFTITGVLNNLPSQSHIQFDMLASFATYTTLNSNFSYSEGWGNFSVRNYILLSENSNTDLIESKIANLYRDNIGDWMKQMGVDFSVKLVPLQDVYLKSTFSNGFGPTGTLDRLKLVSLIGLFIVALACINFININTARSSYRAREVGIRKLAGSRKQSIFWQFMLEAGVLMLFSLFFALLLIEIFLPQFNLLLDKNYQLINIFNSTTLIGSVLLLLFMIIGAGFYPALLLTRINSSDAIKGRIQNSRQGITLRRILVVSQFAISSALVLGTMIILDQLNFMRNQALGFNKEQVLVIDGTNAPANVSALILKNELRNVSFVKNVTISNAIPGKPGWQGQWAYDGNVDSDNHVDTEYMAIDEDYLETLDIKLVAGKNFDSGSPSELKDGLIINQSTVKAFGWESAQAAIGQEIVSPSQHPAGTVIGVVRDFHGQGLQEKIWPMAMDYAPERYGRYYSVRFTTGNTSEVISELENSWKSIYPDHQFDYFFLDQEFDQQYHAEDRLMKAFVLFASIGILIALIGLLGMVAFVVTTKMKEISVRKVHGASNQSISRLLSNEFLLLILIANLIVIGPVWYFGSNWLDYFAYHSTIQPVIFVYNMGITLLLAMLTISYQVINAANVNPVILLRNE